MCLRDGLRKFSTDLDNTFIIRKFIPSVVTGYILLVMNINSAQAGLKPWAHTLSKPLKIYENYDGNKYILAIKRATSLWLNYWTVKFNESFLEHT